ALHRLLRKKKTKQMNKTTLSHNNKKWITLINPQAVNLGAYKEKLEQAIKSYERRLNLVIWRALPQEERDKFKEDGPVQYMQHKEALLEALENLGWPISYEDVILLEDEILAASTYIQQASDLQEAVKKETEKSSESRLSNNKKVIDWKLFPLPSLSLLSLSKISICASGIILFHDYSW
uniref:Uncharacterized protein n=1 Tax=Amazona collaria TaxID=241587 RepID=A0A8B9F535_9PSIT